MRVNESIDWDDVDVFMRLPNGWRETNEIESPEIDWDNDCILIKLPKGWHIVPLDSDYGKILLTRHRLLEEFNDKVCQYVRRMEEEEERRKMCSHETYVISDGYKICKSCYHIKKIEEERCSHEEYVINEGYKICKRDPTQFVPEEGYEDRTLVCEKKNTTELRDKLTNILTNLLTKLSCSSITVENSLERLLKTCESYILPDDVEIEEGKRKRLFRISARLEGLCAALIWREVLISNLKFTMAGFSRKIDVKRTTILKTFKQLDDYNDLNVSKPGRPKKELSD